MISRKPHAIVGAIALIAALLTVGCAAHPQSPNTIRVALLDTQTHRRVAENVRYSILTALPPSTTQQTGKARMHFERREVRGINEQGQPLPIDLKPGAWLIVEHPDYRTVIVDHDGDDAFIRVGSPGQLQLQDMVELPPSPLPDTEHSRQKSDHVRLKADHQLIVEVRRD